MTETEINKALALKIGYLPEHVLQGSYGAVMVNRPLETMVNNWSVFNFMDWHTIMPIAVKYGLDLLCSEYGSSLAGFPWGEKAMAPTLQRAIALAVLGAKESINP